jgi:hypothetical protein
MKCIIKKNNDSEFEVPTQAGLTGADQIAYESDKDAAEDTARFVHGQDVVIVHQRGTYDFFDDDGGGHQPEYFGGE